MRLEISELFQEIQAGVMVAWTKVTTVAVGKMGQM